MTYCFLVESHFLFFIDYNNGALFSNFTKVFILISSLSFFKFQNKMILSFGVSFFLLNFFFLTFKSYNITPSSLNTSLFFLSIVFSNIIIKYRKAFLMIQLYIVVQSVLGVMMDLPLLYSQFSSDRPDIGVNIYTLLYMIIIFLINCFFRQKNILTVCAWSKKVKFKGKWLSYENFLKKNYELSHGMSKEEKDKLLNNLKEHIE